MSIERKPIKRHNSLVQLSREHHFGLLLVWKIRQGLKNNIIPSRISDYVLFFFEKELSIHFREEESLFFSILPKNDLLVIRGYKEHETIYALIKAISENKSESKLLLSFASSLEDHIRFEERILFNHLQNTFSEEDLEKIGTRYHNRNCNTDEIWEDKFWEKRKENLTSGIPSAWLCFIVIQCFFMGA